ncbi:hypothetical protein GCM10009118_18820 [Wandonia haliotis]|uniref:Histidine kinase domain-containing protein n=1 Tax=Wandonia haliotis TaxID=574963 RepID=A0ABN1MQQ9_9FLAO
MKNILVTCLLASTFHFSGLNAQESLFLDKAELFYGDYEYDSALFYYNKAYVEISSDSIEKKARVNYRMGQAFLRKGERESSIARFELAAEAFKKVGNLDNYWIANGQMARIYDDMGDMNKAIELGEKIVHYFVSIEDTASVITNKYNLALFYYHKDDLDKSIKLLLESIEDCGEGYPKSKSKALNQVGNIWADAYGNEKKALEYYRKAQKIKLELNDYASIAFGYNNIGLSHKNLGQPDSAMHYYLLAYEYAIKSNDPSAQVNPEVNIGNLLKKQGLYTEAIPYFLKAYEKINLLPVKQKIVVTTALGNLYNDLKKYQKAIQFLTEAKEYSEETDEKRDLLEVYSYIAFAFASVNQFEEAYENQLKFSNLQGELNKIESEVELTDALVKYETAEKEKEVLKQQKELEVNRLEKQRLQYAVWSVILVTILVIIAAVLLYYRKKEEVRRKNLELSLARQEALNRIQEDRLRISRELHDNIGSYLTFINASVENLNNDNALTGDQRIGNVRSMLKRTMKELRNTVWILNNENASLDEIALRMREFLSPDNSDIQVSIDVLGNESAELNEAETTHLIRLIQEAVNNALKYAQTPSIDIVFQCDLETVQFEVRDYGKGFDKETGRTGNGLRNMEYRIRELGGELSIDSIIGKGTTIAGKFTLKSKQHE